MMIRRLSEDVQGRLRTGVALTGVAQCVEELVLNSVDAGATCVAVRVDLQSVTIQVVDNGAGITKEQLPDVGQRYFTSKCHTVEDLDNLKYFGYRGEALASLCSASSFVEIITRPVRSTTTYSECFHKGKPLSVTEPSQPRPGHGTTVTARNLFYNLPVRKKSLNEGLELEKIRFRVAGLALMWPLISFSLRDDVTGNVVLQTHKCSGILATFSSLFGGARAKYMREVKTQNDIFQVSGYVSRENYSRKDLQFVFVNRRLVLKSKVHKMLNTVLSKSVLVRRRGNTGDKSTKQAGEYRSPFAEGGSPTKLFERYAVYVINIDCPLTAYDITFDPAKTLVEFHDWPELTGLIEAMLLKFLQDENLLLPSEEGLGAEEPGLGSAATVLDKESTSFAPDLMRETDDPFAGADDGFDVEFHADLQRRQYTRGISTHNNLNSLFSRTVRRPIQPHEEEGFGDFNPSSPKKNRPDCGPSGTADESQQIPPGDSKFGTTADKVGSFVTPAGTHPVKGSATGTSQRAGQSAEKQVLPTRRENLRPGNGPRFKEENSPAHNAEGAAESTDSEDAQITLPPAARPLKRVIRPTSHKQMLSERHSDQALASGSASNAKQICLPHHFAHSSSLSRLRARLAGELTPSLSPSSASSNRQETHGGAPATTSSPHIVERSKDQSNSGPAVCKEMLRLGMELDGKPTEIVLPPMKRPPLFRSRSLDAECSKHKIFDSSRASHKTITRMSDDTNINYSSNQMADFEHRKHGSERSSLITINPRHLTARTGMRVGGSAIQNVLGESMPSHRCSGIPHQTRTTHTDAPVPSGVNTATFHRHPVPTNRKEDIPLPPMQQVVHTKDFSKVTSSEIQRTGSSASRPVDHSQSTSKLAHTDQSTAPRPVDHSSSAGPCSFCPSSSKRSGQSTSGPSGPIVSASRSGTVSQASKLAQLMRKKDVPNSCDDTAGSGEAGVSKNPSFHHAHCSCSEKTETALPQRQHLASHSMRTVTQLPQAFYMQREMHGRDQSVHNWHDATALQKLTTAQSIQSTLNQRCSKSTETQEPREKRLDWLSHLEKPHTALEIYSKGEHGKDVHEPGESDAQHRAEQRVYHQNMAACNLLPTSDAELPTSNILTNNKNDMASKMPGDGRNQQKSLRSGRTAGNFPVSQRHVPFSVHKLTAWHDSQQHLCKVPAQSWRGDEVSSSGDGPVPQCPRGHAVSSQEFPAVCASSGRPVSPAQSSSGSHQRVELAQSNTQGFAAVCASSGRPVSPAQSSNGSHQRVALAQSNTQGFAAVSSQGFVPQLIEDGSGTMPFEVHTEVLSQTLSQTHTDSPMSTQSMGFSPTVADPLLADPDARNTTSPVMADLDAKEIKSPVMADPGAKNTTGSIRAHPVAKETTSPVSVDPHAKNTTGPLVADSDAKNTTGPLVADPDAKNTTGPLVADPDAKNTASPVSVDPDAKNTTSPVSVDPVAKNTTSPVSVDPDAKNTTNPVSVDPDAKNTTSPIRADPDAKNTTSPVSVDPDAKNTTNPVGAHPDAVISTMCTTGSSDIKNADSPVTVQEKTTHSQSSVLCPVSSNELAGQKVLALAGDGMTDDFRKMTDETGSSVCVCEHSSCQLPDRPDASSDDTFFSQRLRTCLCGNRSVPVSQRSPAGGQSHVHESGCVLSTREADDLEEENTLTDSSEIPCGQGRIQSLAVSSMASSSSVASSCGSDSQFSESVLGAWPAVVNRPSAKNVHDAENKGSGHNGDHLHTRHRSEHGDAKNQKSRIRLEDGQENDCHEERTFATTSSEVVASGTEPVLVRNNQSPSVSDRTVHQAKRKLAVERTYNLSFLSGKKPRSMITSGSSCAAANKGEPPASLSFSSQACDERTLVENQAKKTPLPSKDFGEAKRDLCLAQESDSFGDSVPDSALACVAMPDNVPASAADSEIKTPISLPDCALASIAMLGNVPAAATRDIGTQNFMPDSAEKYVSTDSKDAQIASNTANSVSNSLADVEMPMNPAVSQTTPAGAVQSVSNTPSSVPDSIIVTAVASESESAASPLPDSQVTGTAGQGLSDSFTRVTPAATIQTGASDTFTQNAYRLGSAPQTAASDGVAGEGPGLSSTQSVFPGMAPSPSKGCVSEEELASEQPRSSRGSPAVGGGGSTRRDGEGVGERGKEARAEALSKEAVWIPVTDPSTGDVVYMNSSSGHTLTQAQWNEKELEQATSSCLAGQRQTTKGKTPNPKESNIQELSPLSHQTLEALLADHFEADEEEAQSKWREGTKSMMGECATGGKTVSDILTNWENPVFKRPDQVDPPVLCSDVFQILQAVTRSQAGRVARCFFHPTTFTKHMLAGAKVIGQLDNKFVVCLIQEDDKSMAASCGHSNDGGEGLLVLFDQHAAHERVRLEQLTSDVYEKGSGTGDSSGRRIQRSDVKPARTVFLSEEDVRLMQSFRDEFDRIGVKFDVDKQHRDQVHIHSIPACMAQREANDRKRGKDPLSYEYVEIMIREHNQLLLSTAGAKQQLPQQVHRLLATHACKGAIKFGDKLSASTCQELLSSLSSCDLPFQCAHGRPSIAPLISLSQLRLVSSDARPPPNLWKLRQQMRAPQDEDQ